MSEPEHQPPARRPPHDKAKVEAVVADCIEAMERGEADPATRICAESPDLLLRVQRRLEQLAARGLMPATDGLPPASIGPYRIVRVLGSGGMGAVYLAEQTEPVRRRVALKVIKLGMDTREVVARFRAERQALALMNHPHIAQVFDAGITAEGRPYFVMEFVGGTALTSFCDQRALPTEQRMRLLATICRAVQHAHDRGFIHRDLKPSNVLVTAHEGEFMPKIIDFGIAKATSAAAAADATPTASEGLRTRVDQVLGTPEYMSPEQARSGGLDIDTRSDVYSLGAVLYELLCGELPFDSARLRRASRHEMERILLDELPTLPSRRLSSVGNDVLIARGGERTTLQRRVAGELDWITLKALAKAPERRYPSALSLAEDLERWLRHEPVLAAPPGRTYRLRKFVRRHRVWVAAAAMVLLSLVTGLVVSLRATSQALQAKQQEALALDDMRVFYGLARDAVGNLVDVADEQLAELPQADAIRRQMLADAIGFYEALRRQEPRDLELRIDLAAANVRIGALQGRLGQVLDGVATLRQGAGQITALQTEAPTHRRLNALAVTSRQMLAYALTRAGQSDAAKSTLREALVALQQAREAPDPQFDPDLAEAGLLGNLAIETDDDLSVAVPLFERALAAHARAASTRGQDQLSRARIAAAYAQALTKQNRLDEASRTIADAVAQLPPLAELGQASQRETAAGLHSQLAGVSRRLERRDEARAAQQRAIDLYGQLAREHPDVTSHRDHEAAGLHLLAQLAQEDADLPRAIELMSCAVEIRDQLVDRSPQDHRLRMRAVRSRLSQAGMEVDAWQHLGADKAVAEATLTRALQQIDELNATNDDDVEIVTTFAGAHAMAAALRSAEGRHGDAIREHLSVRDMLVQKLARWPNNPDMHYQLALVGSNLLQCYYLDKRPADAVLAGERGLEHLVRGLDLDARNQHLLELAPTLVARLSTAQGAAGDEEAGVQTLWDLCAKPEWGQDARETAVLLLNQRSGPERTVTFLERLERELRAAVDARGSLTEALARPMQRSGFSHTQSRLRDFDLRTSLADVCGKLGDHEEQERLLAEVASLADSLPELSPDRVRNFFAQRTELALNRREPATAAQRLEEMLVRGGRDGAANYLAAVLFVQCMAQTDDAPEHDRLGGRAVECLRLAIDKGRVSSTAAGHANFAALRGRSDYLELLTK